ncbi:putative SNARE associated Golgi protein [Elsinoe fawcettii]|nr:putative SNARE associated Golgi protein [Elsinoe fawcettii]
MPALPPDDADNEDYTSTARFLANPPPRHTSISPAPKRSPSTSRGRVPPGSNPSLFPRFTNPNERLSFTSQWPSSSINTSSLSARWQSTTITLRDRVERLLSRFTPLQRILLLLAALVLGVLSLLFLIYNERIFASLVPLVKTWRTSPIGWLVLWLMVIAVSFPPMIGYSTCFTLGGFVFGVWKGWAIVASATVVGSTLSFLASRYILKDYVTRLTARDTRFKALSHVIEKDGLKLLVMIRLCPLPYSLSNGAISTIPSVTPLQMAIATAAAAPKLLIGIFIGSRLGDIAEGGEKMDAGAKVVSYISIAVGVALGVGTGWVMYQRTMKRAKELEEEGTRGAAHGRAGRVRDEEALGEDDFAYTDGADEEIRGTDGISLHTAEGEDGYRDDFEEDGADASSLDAVFQAGDGDDSDAEGRYKDDEEDRR